MKALIKNEEAQAGVGTLIIFIAMVLVAAVAAAVLIQTSGVMQSKSTTTTKEAAAAISENLVVEAIDGNATGAGYLNNISITVRPAAGSSQIDLSKVLLKIGSTPYNYSTTIISYSTTPLSGTFRVFVLRDPGAPNGALNASINDYTATASPGLASGALARLDIGGFSIASKASITISLTPEKGSAFTLPVTLPAIVAGNNAIYP